MTAAARIAVVDYGMGNLRSVMNALDEIGTPGEIVTDPNRLGAFDKAILPGVGAFGEAVENLRRTGLEPALHEYRRTGRDILGICLGMQIMCTDSLENGLHQGLGWIDAHVMPFEKKAGLKVPHMGWNALEFTCDDPIFRDMENSSDVYFVHSYYVDCRRPQDMLATTDYGLKFASMFRCDRVYGMQFHPEKSQSVGLQLLKNFVEC